jgi:hypothetical protein
MKQYVLIIAALIVGALYTTAQTPVTPVPLTVKVYTIAELPFLPKPYGKVLIYLNGLFMSPGVDYKINSSGNFYFTTQILSTGDQVEVVTLP